LVPVEPPHFLPMTVSSQWIVAIEAASGARIIRSMTLAMNDASTRGRPMPSIRELFSTRRLLSPVRYESKNTEFSGSTTQSRVAGACWL
jgi:hypothetical protein